MTDRASFIGVFHLWSTSVFSWGSGMQKYVYLPTGGSWTRDLWRHCGAPFCLLGVAKCSIDIILPSCKIWIYLAYNEPTPVGLCLSICWYGVSINETKISQLEQCAEGERASRCLLKLRWKNKGRRNICVYTTTLVYVQ